jgi:signal transduction histidine kinase
VPRLNATVADVRALVHALRPPHLDEFGLAASVVELAARLSTPEVPVLADARDIPELSAAVDVAAYRIIAEALTNAVRHASASSVRVVVTIEGGSLAIEVRDDGRGVPDEPMPGLGLASMRLRAEELGGTLRMSTGQAGTSVLARIPLVSPSSAGAGAVPRVPVRLS